MFLSYRRQDAAFQADMLYRLLGSAFGPERVFKDVDSIEPGDDFALAIEQAVASCTVLLAVIGDRWLASVDGAGRRRLDDPGDFVRLEIESALRAGVRVVPVLLGTELPAPEQLPPSLAELASRQAVELAPQGFMDGAQRLVERLAVLGRPARPPTGSVAPVPEPPPAAAGTDAAAELVSTAYRLQVADIAPTALRGRDRELALLTALCAGPQPYAWCQAEAWAGKTALMAWFVLHPPPGVDVAAFFVVGSLAGQCDSDAFLEATAEQLTVLAGRPPGAPVTSAVRRGRLLELLAVAAERSRAAGRRLVLVIDGLDEDTSPAAGKESIASLLPRRPAAGLLIVVASRAGRELPPDVPPDHPLRECRPLRVAPSQEAQHVELFAKRELITQLAAGTLHERLIGLVAASGGGLARDDLAQLTGEPPAAVEDLLQGSLGRCLQSRRQRLAGSTGGERAGRGHLFAHDTLRQLAEQEIGPRMAGYRDRLHGWAAGYAARRWPADTPQYLLRDYARMLAMTGNVARLSELAADAARHERMLELTGGDALALDETAAAQAAVLARQPPDLVTAAVLALRRAELTRRNTVVPVGLAAVWAALGNTPRAEALACTAAGAARRGAALADAAQAAATIGHLVDAEALLDAITDGARRERAVAAVVTEAARIDLAHAARLTSRLPAGPLRDSADLVVAAAWAADGPARATDALVGLEERWAGRARPELAMALARAGHPAEAEALLAGAGRRGVPPPALARLAAALAAAGARTAAERVAARIRSPLVRARAYADVIAAAGDAGTVTRLLGELRGAVLRAGDPRAACDVALSLGIALAGTDLSPTAADAAGLAEELLASVPGDQEWVRARRLVARALAGDWAGGVAGLRGLGDPDAVARTTRELALLAEAGGAAERTASLVAAVPDVRRRAELLTALARAAIGRGDRDRATELARAAERTARRRADLGRLATAADHVVDGLIVLGALDEAITLAGRIPEPERRESALGRVAAALAGAGRVDQARELADRLGPERRAWGLATIAQQAVDAGDRAAARAAVAETVAMIGSVPDGFSRAAVLIKLARVSAGLGDPAVSWSLLRDADGETGGLAPDRRARALTLLAVVAGDLGFSEWAAVRQRQAGVVLAGIDEDTVRNRVHARLTEALAEVGHVAAADHHLGLVDGAAARVRAACALAAVVDAGRAGSLLAEAAALVPAIERVEDRAPALARLAVTAATVGRGVGAAPTDPAWTLRPVAELLTGEAWSFAAPALAHLEADAARVLASWVTEQLGTAGE